MLARLTSFYSQKQHIKNDLFDELQEIISNSYDVNSPDANGWTQLFHAVDQENLQSVDLLLKNGALPNTSIPDKTSVLHWAVYRNHLPICKLLVANINDGIDHQNDTEKTPLHFVALYHDNDDMAELLLQKGANPNAWDVNLETPLHIAAKKNRLNVALKLISQDAEVNALNNLGETPLHLAVKEGHQEMVEMLIALGANVNCTDYNYETPLHHAARDGHLEITTHLLHICLKADLLIINKHRKTPLDLATEHGNWQIRNALEKAIDIKSCKCQIL